VFGEIGWFRYGNGGCGIGQDYLARMKKRFPGADTSKFGGIRAGWSADKMNGIGPSIAVLELMQTALGFLGGTIDAFDALY
jgi:hypothetical protein